MARARRLRGWLLRIVLHRRAALAAGALCAAPGALLTAMSYAWETPVTDAVALLSLATGAALVWAGLTGRRPDWME